MVSLLHVSQPTEAGLAVMVGALVEAGIAGDFDVTVASPEGTLSRWAQASGAAWVPVRLVRPPSAADARNVAEMRELLRSYDIVHLHSSKAGAVGRLALRTMPARQRPMTAFTPHGWSWLSGGPLAPTYRAFEWIAAPWVDVIVTVSEAERRTGGRVIRRARCSEVIENAVDTDHWQPAGEVAPRTADPLIVCVGRLHRAKGQDVAVRALGMMTTPRVRLRLIGDGEELATVREAAAQAGVTDRVELLGELSDPAPHLRAADVVVVPSRWEGQAIAMLEAMACGAAVVSTAVPGSEALDGCGVVVPVEDPAALARAMDDLLGDAERRATLGRDARSRAVARFDRRDWNERWVGLWQGLGDRRHLRR